LAIAPFSAWVYAQLNLANPAARAWMINTARYWLREFDVDGYRLDYANGPGPDFWTDFWPPARRKSLTAIASEK